MAPARIAIAIAAAIAVTWLATQAVRLGSAGETVYRSAQERASWSASGQEPDRQGVDWLVSDLQDADRLAPHDPNVQELLGSLAAKRIDRQNFLDEALAYYRRAVQLRPTSPYVWAEIVATDYRRGDTGAKIEAALRNAAMLGPAEPEVQRTVIDYGLALWDEEAPETRRAVETTITGAMKRDPGETLQIAERRDRLAVACRHLADAPRRVDPEWRLLCRGRGEQ
jgi:cytochrome c-type biogenesis protein CcmH/NrfG